ncbi:MAG: hypothetical protein K2M46_06465 [Lachnospiraceae bacterium]|nr:hypothetical protein [Lachnospiraceae bacterium]
MGQRMKAAIEIYVNTIVLMMIVSCCLFFICSSLRNAQARNFHSATMAKIEASAGSERVITESIEEARQKGYELLVTPATLYEDKQYFYVELLYEYELPFLGTKRESKIEGFAR